MAYELDNNWDESTVTWNTMPTIGAQITSAPATPDAWFELDLSNYITGKRIYSIALDTPIRAVMDLMSEKNKASPNCPFLEVKYHKIEDTDDDHIPDDQDPDDDNDGMSDTLENQYGFDPLDPSDAAEDADSDGVTNLDEILAGTDPTDPNSH
jgi:hypothetical protein